MSFRLTFAAALIALAPAACADEVSDTIEAALEAYRNGELQVAIEELAYASQLMQEMKTQSLSAFLPEPPRGWDREIDTEMAAGMAIMGGGVGAEATYSRGSESFTITMMADNPMVQGFAGMLGNIGMLAGIKRVRIGGQRFADQDGELVGLIGNRVLVQARGADQSVMVPLLETIDFDALESFGR